MSETLYVVRQFKKNQACYWYKPTGQWFYIVPLATKFPSQSAANQAALAAGLSGFDTVPVDAETGKVITE